MSQNKLNKKRVSFADKIDISNINTNGKIINEIKKSSALKGNLKKNEELKNEKVLEVINEEKHNIKETGKEIKLNELKDKNIEEPIFTNNKINHKMKQLSTEEYFKITIQTELEKGLLIALCQGVVFPLIDIQLSKIVLNLVMRRIALLFFYD